MDAMPDAAGDMARRSSGTRKRTRYQRDCRIQVRARKLVRCWRTCMPASKINPASSTP